MLSYARFWTVVPVFDRYGLQSCHCKQCVYFLRCKSINMQRLQTEVAHRGFYSFKVNATDFLDPYDPSVRSKPELYEVAMNSQLSSQLSDSTVATIGGVSRT